MLIQSLISITLGVAFGVVTLLNTDFSAEKLIKQIHEIVVKDKEYKDATCRGYDEIFKEMEKWIGKTYGRKCPNHRPSCLAWSEWEQFKLKWLKNLKIPKS